MTNKTNAIAIIFLICAFAVITGCETTETEGTAKAYLGGTQGLIASFNPIGLNNEISQDDSFAVEVQIDNKGEFDIKENDLKAYLENVPDFNNIPSTTLYNTEPIFRKTTSFEGGTTTITFSNNAKYNSIIPGAFRNIDLYATICYPYRTIVEAKACYNTNTQDLSICNITKDLEYETSGAPLQVVNVKENKEGSNQIAVYFEIENQGNGKPTLNCDDIKAENKFNFEMLTDKDTSNPWDCRYGGSPSEGKLISNKATVRCIKKLNSGDNFEKPIVFYIDYKYTTTIKQALKINKAE